MIRLSHVLVVASFLLLVSTRSAQPNGCGESESCVVVLDLDSGEPPSVQNQGRKASEFPPQPCASNLKCKNRELEDCQNVGFLNTNIGFIPVISAVDSGGAFVVFGSDIVPFSFRFLDNDTPGLGFLFRPLTTAFTGTPDNQPFLVSLTLAPKVRPPATLEPPPYIFGFDFALYNRASLDAVPLETVLYRRGTFRNGGCDLEDVFRPIPQELLTIEQSDNFQDARDNPVVVIPAFLTVYRLRVTFETDTECASFLFSTTTPCCTVDNSKFKNPGCNRPTRV